MASLAIAQTFTDYNPLQTQCPDNKGLNQGPFISDFTKNHPSLDQWKITGGTLQFSDQGAELAVRDKGDAPTLQSKFYIFFGKVEVKMKVAPGIGIVSAMVLESNVLDEIGWTNYFGRGDTSFFDRGSFETFASPRDVFHTYAVEYTPEKITWSIDGTAVRTVTFDEAKGGTRYPQQPMTVKIGLWEGGDLENDAETIQWAGGQTDYSAGPFTMYINSISASSSCIGHY
ncbi:hypothetical protein EYZ11_010147 [Aspergillus tanneri]|uniref:chitinase n=1 Tax=Aspergillus tanneri TaxID=1220188 RepID=A0A4V3UN99_9EURO|nr:hypothetical protein EYZ11_010147 [Aspergillus tanneri]